MNIYTLPQQTCEKCGNDEFEVYHNNHVLGFVCTRCMHTMEEEK